MLHEFNGLRKIDAFYKANSAQAIAEMQTKFETQKKEATIAQQQYRLIRKNYFIYGTLGLLAATLLIGFAIFKNRQKNQQLKLQEMAINNEQAINDAKEDERQRILADLHDDVGSGLSSIRMVSDLIIQQHQQVQQVNEYALKISRISQEVTLRMNTIVWALNSENDTLQNLCEYIREYGYTFFENSAITFECKIPENIDNVDLGGLQRKNIFLCIKEALHNTLNHSKAKNAWIDIAWKDKQLRILFADNGKGMVKENQFGNGLRNIQKRMKEINGSVTFGTKEGVEMVLELHI